VLIEFFRMPDFEIRNSGIRLLKSELQRATSQLPVLRDAVYMGAEQYADLALLPEKRVFLGVGGGVLSFWQL
jgi:hypothetical protein